MPAFRDGRPTGTGEISGWFTFDDAPPDEQQFDAFGLLQAADAFAPVCFNRSEVPLAWAPTLELTVHVRGVPAPGPLRCRFRNRFMQHGLFEEDGEMWDSLGCARRSVAAAGAHPTRVNRARDGRLRLPSSSPATKVPAASAVETVPATVRRMTVFVRSENTTTGHPLSRAWRSSLPSGLTATGWPTALSIGRSLWESL